MVCTSITDGVKTTAAASLLCVLPHHAVHYAFSSSEAKCDKATMSCFIKYPQNRNWAVSAFVCGQRVLTYDGYAFSNKITSNPGLRLNVMCGVQKI